MNARDELGGHWRRPRGGGRRLGEILRRSDLLALTMNMNVWDDTGLSNDSQIA